MVGTQVAHLTQRAGTPSSPAGLLRQEDPGCRSQELPSSQEAGCPLAVVGEVPTLAVTMCSPKCRTRSPRITSGSCSLDSSGSAVPSRRKHR